MSHRDHGIISPSFFLGRQEKTFEYEVKWQFKSMDSNTWVEKDRGRPWQTMADHGRPWQMETQQGRMDGASKA